MPKGVYKRPTLETRFWDKVNKNGPIHPTLKTRCWEWTACLARGYGAIQVSGGIIKVHRMSWQLHKGDIPEGLFVLHRCDNPICVNPTHLFLGTHQDNMKDMKAKERTNAVEGEQHHLAKMTVSKVKELRNLREQTGLSYDKLAKRFGISTMQAYDIIKRKAWKHVP